MTQKTILKRLSKKRKNLQDPKVEVQNENEARVLPDGKDLEVVIGGDTNHDHVVGINEDGHEAEVKTVSDLVVVMASEGDQGVVTIEGHVEVPLKKEVEDQEVEVRIAANVIKTKNEKQDPRVLHHLIGTQTPEEYAELLSQMISKLDRNYLQKKLKND